MQRDAVHTCDRVAHVADEALEVCGARLAMVDDEVRVLLGHRGIADAKALEARRLDETCSVIARRIGEHRAAAPLPDRLSGLALGEQLLYFARMRAGTALEAELRREEPFLRYRRDYLAVADAIFLGRAAVRAPAAIDGFERAYVRPGLSAESTGVHRQRPAQGAGNAGKELRRSQSPLDALSCD